MPSDSTTQLVLRADRAAVLQGVGSKLHTIALGDKDAGWVSTRGNLTESAGAPILRKLDFHTF